MDDRLNLQDGSKKFKSENKKVYSHLALINNNAVPGHAIELSVWPRCCCNEFTVQKLLLHRLYIMEIHGAFW